MNKTPKEIWRDWHGLNGLYQVSNHWRIKSMPRATSKGCLIKPWKTHWYLFFSASVNWKKNYIRIARLVAMTYISNPKNLPYVNHIDCNKLNNHVSNLEWCSPKENSRHAYQNWLYKTAFTKENNPVRKGKYNSRARPISQFTLDWRLIKNWDCSVDASVSLGIHKQSISNILRGREKSAHGFTFLYS